MGWCALTVRGGLGELDPGDLDALGGELVVLMGALS
jgi:hypothetical protein